MSNVQHSNIEHPTIPHPNNRYRLRRNTKKLQVNSVQSVKTCENGDVIVLSSHDANFSETTTKFSPDPYLQAALESIQSICEDVTLQENLSRHFNASLSVEEIERGILLNSLETEGILENTILTLAETFRAQAISYVFFNSSIRSITQHSLTGTKKPQQTSQE